MERASFNVKDLGSIINVSDPVISPDSRKILWVKTSVSIESDEYLNEIMLYDFSQNESYSLTLGDSPIWSPDGKTFAYIGSEDGKNGIWLMDIDSGKKRFLASVAESFYFMGHMADMGFRWSSDGKYIAFVSSDPEGEDISEEGVRVIDRLSFKTKGGRIRPKYHNNKLTHIYIVNVGNGEIRCLTEGIYNEHSLTWSPDGSHISFISNHSDDADQNHYNDLFKIDLGSGVVTRLPSGPGVALCPSWSPDGKTIAYLATSSEVNAKDSQSDDTHIYLIPEGGGTSRCISKKYDRRVENIFWSKESDFIYFTAGNHGRTPLNKISVKDGEVQSVIPGDRHVMGYDIDGVSDRTVFVSASIDKPTELYSFQEGEIRQLTFENEEIVKRVEIRDGREIWLDSFDGTRVQGWLIEPSGFDSSKKYPLVLVIHGGPHNMFGYDYEDRMQILAGKGYGVFYMNPRGSSGYGQTFSRGCVMNWGGGDYKDLMSGVDYVINNYKWVDAERLAVTGQSYGGYMTNWIITQTDRFKAAVSDGGLSNLISFGGTSLYHLLMDAEYLDKPWNVYPLLWQWSPLSHVKNVTTPTLFLHGETDNEVPITQSEEMFVALKKLGVKTQFIQYLGEGHGWRPDLKPKNRIDLFTRMLNWFDQYVK